MADGVFRGYSDLMVCGQFGYREYAVQILFRDASLLPADCDRFAQCCDLGGCRRTIMREVKREGMEKMLMNRQDVS